MPGKAHRNPTTTRKHKERFADKAAKKREAAEAVYDAAKKRWRVCPRQPGSFVRSSTRRTTNREAV
jgi:hypothetical protein